jgi:hypothetical protein
MPAVRWSGLVAADPVTYTAQLGTESVSVTFDAAKMTGRWERALAAAMRAEDYDVVSDMVLDVFIAWDVVDDAGQPIPISRDLLLDLPNRALARLMEGMRTAANPVSEEGNGSAATSSTPDTASMVLPASPPNGQPTLPSPPLSTSQSQT